MKTKTNTNLSLEDVMKLVVSTIATKTINDQLSGSLVNNDTITNVTPIDVAKKNRWGVVVSIGGGGSELNIYVKLTDGSEIEVNKIETVGIASSNTPVIGSSVLVGFDNNNEPFILKVNNPSDIIIGCRDSLFFDVRKEDVDSGASILLKENSFTMNDGSYGGIPIVDEIQKNFDAIEKYLKNMEINIINALTAIGVGTAASGPSGASSFQSANAANTIKFGDMENPDITHGII